MGYKLNGVESEGIPEHIVKIFTSAYEVPYLVETGTAGGASITKAAGWFRKCYTIELIDGRVGEDLKKNHFLHNVEFLTGDSVELLPSIFTNFVGEYAFVFLDAHFSDSIPNTTGYKECPVLQELKVMAVHQKSIILIDDARLFFGHPPYPCDPREWPMIEDVFAACKLHFPNHHTTIVDDFILCYPDEMGGAVISAWTKRFPIRYPSAEEKVRADAQNVYQALKSYLDV